MRTLRPTVVLAPPDVPGFCAAAALAHGGVADLQWAWDEAISRRIFGFESEPRAPDLHVCDLVPTDSVESLLVPALRTLRERGRAVTWWYGRSEPQPVLERLGSHVDLRYHPGVPPWTKVTPDGSPLRGILESIVTEPDHPWRVVLEALAASWDWARSYRCVRTLSDAGGADPADVEWAQRQLARVADLRDALRDARMVRWDGLGVAVVEQPDIGSRFRPHVFVDVFAGGDADAVAFVTGPGRISLHLARSHGDLSMVEQVIGGSCLHTGSLEGRWTEIAWDPEAPPETIRPLIDRLRPRAPEGVATRVLHPRNRRIAKGLHPVALAPEDAAVLAEAARAAAGRGAV